MDIITRYLKFFGFTNQKIEQILQYGQLVEIKKGQVFANENEICNKMGVLLNGLLYSYNFNALGNKNISQFFFTPDNYLVVDYKSYSQNSKSEVSIEAIENSKILVFERSVINQLYETYPNLIQIQREMARKMYIDSLSLINIFQTYNTVERIKILQDTAPNLFAKVPYSYLASFLGIHRNTFNAALKRL